MAEVIERPERVSFITGSVRGTADCNWWGYAAKVKEVARSFRRNYGSISGNQADAVKAFLDGLAKWTVDEDEGTAEYFGTRPWLGVKLNLKAVSQKTFYVGDTGVEPVWVQLKVLDHISRDLKKTPVSDAEKDMVDALYASFLDPDYAPEEDDGEVEGGEPSGTPVKGIKVESERSAEPVKEEPVKSFKTSRRHKKASKADADNGDGGDIGGGTAKGGETGLENA